MNDPPDLVIVDISLKDGSGLELIKDIKAQFKQIKMLTVSMHDENLFAERSIRAGALGFVNKQQAPEQLVTPSIGFSREKSFSAPKLQNA